MFRISRPPPPNKCAVYGMWKNTVQPARTHLNTVWRIRTAR